MFPRSGKLLVAIASLIPLGALAGPIDDHISRADLAGAEVTSGPNMTIPLDSWPVDTKEFIQRHTAAAKAGNLKAATDRATVYRPIPVCRLVDTRGNPAWVTIPGPLTPGITNVPAAGRCGIPGTGVSGLSISFHVLNLTPSNGGTIAFLQQGAPLNGVNAVFNPGAQWTAATANVSIPDDSGNFEISTALSTIQLVIDVNGYYQDLDFIDTGNQELDIRGDVSCPPAGGCKVFEVTNLGNGNALVGTNLGNGPGLAIGAGSFLVAGAGIGSGTTGFIFEVNTGTNVCGATPSVAVIDHPMLNGDPNALLLITPREGAPASVGTAPAGSAGPVAAVYHACGTVDPNSRWGIRDKSGASLVNHSQYSVFIIKSQ